VGQYGCPPRLNYHSNTRTDSHPPKSLINRIRGKDEKKPRLFVDSMLAHACTDG